MKNNNTTTASELQQLRKHELLHHASKNEMPGFDTKDLTNAQPLLLFSLENDNLNISYTNAAFEKLIGYSPKIRADYGKAIVTRFIQINDFRIIKQKIIPALLQHLKKKQHDCKRYSTRIDFQKYLSAR